MIMRRKGSNPYASMIEKNNENSKKGMGSSYYKIMYFKNKNKNASSVPADEYEID
jgi:hypothetical protein